MDWNCSDFKQFKSVFYSQDSYLYHVYQISWHILYLGGILVWKEGRVKDFDFLYVNKEQKETWRCQRDMRGKQKRQGDHKTEFEGLYY